MKRVSAMTGEMDIAQVVAKPARKIFFTLDSYGNARLKICSEL